MSRPFKIGDKVTLVKGSEYYRAGENGDITNPHDTIGEITKLNDDVYDEGSDAHSIRVEWATYTNGNVYRYSDLKYAYDLPLDKLISPHMKI